MTDIRDRIIAEASACLGQTDPVPFLREAAPAFAPGDRPSWCGIFVRAIWRRAGLEVSPWQIGLPNTARLRKVLDPQPGDLVQWRGALGHQSIFESFDGSIVISLDGNTSEAGRSGVVARKRRPRADVLCYYSAPIERVRDTEPAPPPSAPPSGDAARPVTVPARIDTAAGLPCWPSVLEVWSAYSVPLEGSVPWLYLDGRGLVTTGVGCLLTGEDQAAQLGWVHASGEPATVAEVQAEYRRVQAMPHGLVAARYRGALRLPDVAVERLMLDRLGYAARAMAKAFSSWRDWPADAQLAALSMAWACGTGWVGARWPRLTAACYAHDWETAALECTIREAGNPGVVLRNVQQRSAFRNAAVVAAGNPSLRVSECYWPLELETDL